MVRFYCPMVLLMVLSLFLSKVKLAVTIGFLTSNLFILCIGFLSTVKSLGRVFKTRFLPSNHISEILSYA